MTLVFANRFLHWFCVGLIIPVLNLLLLSRGMDLAGVGLATALYSAVIVLLELPTGILADLIGRKKCYLVALLFSLGAYSLLLGSAGAYLAILGLLLAGVARALSSGSIEALFIDDFIAAKGEAELHRLTSLISLAEASGLALGALAGGALPDLWSALVYAGKEPGARLYDANLLAQLLIVALNLCLVGIWVREKTGTLGGQGRERPRLGIFLREGLGFVGGNRPIRLLLLGGLAWGLCFAGIELLWQPRFQNLLGPKAGSLAFGALSSGYFLAAMAGSAIVSALISRRRPRLPRLLALLRLVNGLFIILLAFQVSVPGFAFLYLSMFAWNGMASPAESALFNSEAPSERRASLLSLSSLFMQLGGIVGALGLGLLASLTTIPLAWVLAGLVLSASAFLYFRIDAEPKPGLPTAGMRG